MKRVKLFWKRRRRWQRIMIVMGLLALIMSGAVYQWVFAGLPDLDHIAAGMALPSTRIYDRQGRLLYQIADPNTGINQVDPAGLICRSA